MVYRYGRSYNYLLFSYDLIYIGVYFFTTVKIGARASVYRSLVCTTRSKMAYALIR